jgi:DNA-binding CsgD family transcriptional regulator/transcriptional regulator with GAF, ATPase, and Fis domain
MRNVMTSRDYREISADAVRQAILGVADCRSLIDLRNTLFCHIDSLIGVAAMGLYLFDSDDELRYVASCRAPQGFLDDYQREYRKVDTMLECILARRHTVDGFRFHGPAKWRHCGNYDLLRGWGFHHNMAGALVVNGRTAGVLYVATAHDVQPFEDVQVGRLDLMCRAGSLALDAMHARERLWSELSNIAAADWREVWSGGRELPGTGSAPDGITAIERLPTRSREVALLLCRGQSNKAIARQLGISVYTVKEHVHNLCRRFGAVNRTELVRCLLKSS